MRRRKKIDTQRVYMYRIRLGDVTRCVLTPTASHVARRCCMSMTMVSIILNRTPNLWSIYDKLNSPLLSSRL